MKHKAKVSDGFKKSFSAVTKKKKHQSDNKTTKSDRSMTGNDQEMRENDRKKT